MDHFLEKGLEEKEAISSMIDFFKDADEVFLIVMITIVFVILIYYLKTYYIKELK